MYDMHDDMLSSVLLLGTAKLCVSVVLSATMSGVRKIVGLFRLITVANEAQISSLCSRLPVTPNILASTAQGPQTAACFHSAAVAASSRTDSEKQVDEINRLFAEAREELEGAREV